MGVGAGVLGRGTLVADAHEKHKTASAVLTARVLTKSRAGAILPRIKTTALTRVSWFLVKAHSR